MKKTLKVVVFLFVLMVVIFSDAFFQVSTEGNKQYSLSPSKAKYPLAAITPISDIVEAESEKTSDPKEIDKIISEMTIEEKVGQLFIVSLRRLPSGGNVEEMNSDVRNLITKYKVGGVILFGENIDTIPQTTKLIGDLQATAELPLFMSIDEEGGKVSRLSSSGKMHNTIIPPNEIIGNTRTPLWAEKVGNIIGQEVYSLGFNMDFAPVADINTNSKNPIIGNRAFGSGPIRTSGMVAAEVKGLQNENVSAVLKHFPGHGDTATDSHTGAASVSHTKKRLNEVEFKPFISGIKAGADAVMVGHIMVPKVESGKIPASLSKKMITDILRNELKFNGLIITDALDMGAISKYYSSENAAIKAFQAGADLLLMPYRIDRAYHGMIKAVKDGRISEARLNASLRRILEVKEKRGILDKVVNSLDPEKTLGAQEHINIINQLLNKGN